MSSAEYQRIRELFQEAITLDEDQWAAFLAHHTSDDPAVLEGVRKLLRHHMPDSPLMKSEEREDPRQTQRRSSPAHTKRFGDTQAEAPVTSQLGVLDRRSRQSLRFRRERRLVILGGILILVLLSGIGFQVHGSIRRAVTDSLQRTMQALLEEQVFAVETWLDTEERLIRTWARSDAVAKSVVALQAVAAQSERLNEDLKTASARESLNSAMEAATGSVGKYQFAVWNREGTLLADSSLEHSVYLGNGTTEYGAGLLSRVFGKGHTVLWLPTREGFITDGFELLGPVTRPGIALITPVRDDRDRIVAAMLVATPSLQHSLEQLLEKARFGETGEAYAFAEDGFLLTESRFPSHLTRAGLLQEGDLGYSAHVVRVADPGGNLLDGFQPTDDVVVWPLTRAAASAVSGSSGSDFAGYRDYRGVMVVGVWAWLPKHRFAIATEIDLEHAYSPLSPLNNAFTVIVAALAIVAVLAAAAAFALLRARRRSALVRVGPYALQRLLGEGGFAHVYLASHSLLKRPTAVKILKQEQNSERNLVRFEREVQLASSLTHPNTIGIYDYGSTPDGRFYYSMEYINGFSLRELIDLEGAQPPERIVWILTQISRSLREAHARGLVHRDIKPQNIMLCQHGGESDTVKVLDFGLARNLSAAPGSHVTETQLLIGTPLYIAPERIVDPSCMDPRSDIYSLGILAYFLLTGREPFVAANSMDALAQTMSRAARFPSEQSDAPIPETLDQLIHDCHARMVTQRPPTIDAVLQRLDQIVFAEPWNSDRAEAWWVEYQMRARGKGPSAGEKTQHTTKPDARSPGVAESGDV